MIPSSACHPSRQPEHSGRNSRRSRRPPRCYTNPWDTIPSKCWAPLIQTFVSLGIPDASQPQRRLYYPPTEEDFPSVLLFWNSLASSKISLIRTLSAAIRHRMIGSRRTSRNDGSLRADLPFGASVPQMGLKLASESRFRLKLIMRPPRIQASRPISWQKNI